MIKVKSTAYPTYPTPLSRPAPMAMNMAPISLAVPGIERNLTRLNAPATAIPVPMLSLTVRMTIETMAGTRANVMTNPCEYSLR